MQKALEHAESWPSAVCLWRSDPHRSWHGPSRILTPVASVRCSA